MSIVSLTAIIIDLLALDWIWVNDSINIITFTKSVAYVLCVLVFKVPHQHTNHQPNITYWYSAAVLRFAGTLSQK